MKKLFLLLILCLVGVAVFVCYTFQRVFDHDISVSVKEYDNIYQLKASYSKSRTRHVQRSMDEAMHTNNYFEHSRIDGNVTLDDKTNFYVKTSPGFLLIRMDKSRNDSAAYARVKEMEKEIKETITDN